MARRVGVKVGCWHCVGCWFPSVCCGGVCFAGAQGHCGGQDKTSGELVLSRGVFVAFSCDASWRSRLGLCFQEVVVHILS